MTSRTYSRRKARKLGITRKPKRDRRLNSDANARSNEIAGQHELPDELPGFLATPQDYEEYKRRREQIEKKQRERAKRIARQNISNDPALGKGIDVEPDGLSDEQVRNAILVGGAREADRIFLVSTTSDNALWEPFYFDGKNCVRINRMHRFARMIYEDNKNNGDLTVVFNLLMLHMSAAEFYVQSKFRRHSAAVIEETLQEYRRVTTEFLAHLCREMGDLLPAE